MNVENKQRIINNLFDNKFNLDNFKEFVANILNFRVENNEESPKIYATFLSYIISYQVISNYTDIEKNKITVMCVKIKEDKDPIRARVKQREFIAKLMRKCHKDGALVVFYNEDSLHWRMSFIRLNYEFTIKGIEEKITPAKRLSYVVGEGEACKTAKDQFYTLTNLEEDVSLSKLEEVFALEKVTNEFFKEYKNKYLDIKEILINDENFMSEAKKHDNEKPESFAEGFAKKLMGQISFIYFLQKKGWLGIKIVPESMNLENFNKFYKSASEKGKDILTKIYEREEQDLFLLNKEKMKKLNNKIDGEILARIFVNSEFFNEWGTGDKKFLRTLFDKHLENDKDNGKTFFEDYLELLFYNNFSEDRGELQYSIEFDSRIPFLNGGLFDPYGDYKWRETKFNLKDELFSNDDETGILDIFDRYNFTINENDSYETEVAVDPEMLGKVFENLLDVSDRKSKGAFYTPREIVHYMTNESIINYLLTNLKDTDIKKEELDYLFNFGEFSKEYDSQKFEQDYLKKGLPLKNEKGDSELTMKRNIIVNCKKIDTLLTNIKIADPACGSGAFPLGLLNEIVRTRNILTFYINMTKFFKEKEKESKKYWKRKFSSDEKRSLYTLKLETIQNCLYGVDIEPSAIDITKLRLWLSIIVDSDNDNVKPLPNLDFNFMIGNSLIDEFEGMKLFDESLLNEVEEDGKLEQKQLIKESKLFQSTLFKTDEERKQDILKVIFKKQAEYFNERNSEKKKELKREIESLENQLIRITLILNGNEKKLEEIEKGRKERRKPYFLWKLEFAKVFKENGGFDIVIGNPPYVQIQKLKDHNLVKTAEKKYQVFQKSTDLYCLFYEQGINLIKKDGILSFITSNKWLRASYGQKLREYILENTVVIQLIDLGEGIFETATVDTNILFLKKEKKENFKSYGASIKNSKDSILKIKELLIPVKLEKENSWEIIDEKFLNLKKKILKKGKQLKLWNIKINRGILTGYNSAFFINEDLKNKFINVNIKNSEILKPILKGKNIKKFSINFEKLWLITTHNGYDNIPKIEINDYPNIKEWLDIHYDKLAQRTDKGDTPYNLRNCSYFSDFFKEKIIYPETTQGAYFYYDNSKEFIVDKTNFIITGEKLKYLTALLSSKLLTFTYKKFCNGVILGNKGYQYNKHALELLPVYYPSNEDEQKIVKLIEKVIELKKLNKDIQALENQIDEMVYDLYELTEEEKKLVREF